MKILRVEESISLIHWETNILIYNLSCSLYLIPACLSHIYRIFANVYTKKVCTNFFNILIFLNISGIRWGMYIHDTPLFSQFVLLVWLVLYWIFFLAFPLLEVKYYIFRRKWKQKMPFLSDGLMRHASCSLEDGKVGKLSLYEDPK